MTEFEMYSREEITRILIELGIPANLQGFRCLRECSMEAMLHPELLKHVTKQLYPTVGRKLELESSVVERSMRHSTNIGYDKTGFNCLNRLFDLTDKRWDFKPSSSELIAMIADYVRLDVQKKGYKISEEK